MAKNDKLTPELLAEILEDISGGESLNNAARKRKVAPSSVRYKLITDPELSACYARARFSQARAHFEEMEDLEAQVLRGDLDPKAYRVVADSRKWRLAKLHPSEYGDKTHLELSGSVDIAGRIQESRRRAQVEQEEVPAVGQIGIPN